MTRRGPGALKMLWHPDRGGVIPQANGLAFEVLDADGGFLGDGFAVVGNVPSGQEFSEEHFTNVPAPNPTASGVSCRPIDVTRFASN